MLRRRGFLPLMTPNAAWFGHQLARRVLPVLMLWWGSLLHPVALFAQVEKTSAWGTSLSSGTQSVLTRFCLDCHGDNFPEADLNLKQLLAEPVLAQSISDNDHSSAVDQSPPVAARQRWQQQMEKVVRRMQSRQMPPPGQARPEESTYTAVVKDISEQLDRLAQQHPVQARSDSIRRLTRTEYQNAIRDLLGLQIDASTLLPADESSHGFDNITVGELSPTLINRYVVAAQKIAGLAVGALPQNVGGETFRIRPDLSQEDHVTGLPLGTRGGTLIEYNFPQGGQYDLQIRLARDRNEHVEGLRGQHQLIVLLDRYEVARFQIRPPGKSGDHSTVDADLNLRLTTTAGPHRLGVTFLRNSDSLLETKRQPYEARFNMHRHPRTAPAVFQVSIVGPYQATGAGDSPSRRRLFDDTFGPTTAKGSAQNQEDVDGTAAVILKRLLRRAYRRPVTDEDLAEPLEFFRQNWSESLTKSGQGIEAAGAADAAEVRQQAFDRGIEAAVAAVLVNPNFLFRIERDPPESRSGQVFRISDFELASRLSFFLWSSIPDDELLDLAARQQLSDPQILDQQVQRMLDDPRSKSLVTNFADQWLYLRNLDSAFPDMRLFPDFDHNLRQAMRNETELFFASIIDEDRSVLDLLQADYTFLNERLARHYGIRNIRGDHFRRINLPADARRGGLLKHASILTVTSYATRTSPVIRGHWVLKNLIGSPPPPPPANVPALQDNTVLDSLPMRERLGQHRADPNCASCHDLMDPVGFALENYDAIGRWRERDGEYLVDALGGLPDGSEFIGVDGLERGILQRPQLFVSTLVEKLLTYALGRGIEYSDAPAVREIVKSTADEDYRFSSLIREIVHSTPFQMRTVQ